MSRSKTILITGASGFLGTWLSEAAHAQGHTLLGVDIVAPRRPDMFSAFATHPCDRADYAAVLGNHKLDVVFHLAGAASVSQSIENPNGDFASVMPGTVALLTYVGRAHPNAHFLIFSSAAVYGNPLRLPICEDDQLSPISPYGIHKAGAEFLVGQYARLYGFRASLLRIFSAYGEGLRRQVVWDVCQKAIAAARSGERVVRLQGTGAETRDFIHAADVARAALLVMQNPPSSGTQLLNIASGSETTIRSLAKAVCDGLGGDFQISFGDVTRIGDPVNWRADITRLESLGFRSTVSFTHGIKCCIAWQKTIAEISDYGDLE